MSKTDQALKLLAAGEPRAAVAAKVGTSVGSLKVLLWKRRHPKANARATRRWRRENPNADRDARVRYAAKCMGLCS